MLDNSSMSFLTSLISKPIKAASTFPWVRNSAYFSPFFNNSATNFKLRQSVAAKAVYSPKECPAQKFASLTLKPNSFFNTSKIAIDSS